MMENPRELETTAHLVAHALREVESALRGVFKPVTIARSEDKAGASTHEQQIRAILQSLGIPEHSPGGKAWLELPRNLASLVHRRGLDAPRAVDEIREIWDSAQLLLEVLLRALGENFLSWVAVLDELLQISQPTKDHVKRLSQNVPNNYVLRSYFFDKLENPKWLELRRAKKDFFKRPPAPIKGEGGRVYYLRWPEAWYLARMAQHKPELVAQIIQEMDETDNFVALSYLVDALLAMAPDVSARLEEKAARWAEYPYPPLTGALSQLISHLAKGGKTKEAMAIARALLDILPDPRQLEPQARLETWEYEHILKEHCPDLVREAGLPALELVFELLDKAIRLLQRRDGDQRPKDNSYIWRPAIEDHSQNLGHTIEDALVTGVRDAAELVVRSGLATIEETVNVLESKPWKVFRRIALHLTRVFSEQAAALAATTLTDRSLFDDLGLRHEYVLLLRECFPRLTPEDQAQILGWIENRPEVEEWKRLWEGETGRQPTEEEVAHYREIWQRDWLARIGPDNLPEEWKERYQNLCGKYGEPDHPEFPVYTEAAYVGPTSLKTADELKAMSVDEIVEFLKRWRPPGNVFTEPSPEGLGRVLSSVVAEDPGRFAADAPKFQELDPTYVRAVLSGLRNALSQGRPFDWEPVFDLCEWVLSQPREIPGRQVRTMDADPDWGWTRKTIADLLSAGFEEHPGGIPIGLRRRVWAILKPLTEDPDPSPEYEERYGDSNMDPATLSINTTRGEAMHAVVRYALWVRRHLEREPKSEERLQKGFEEMPEVREVLEAHLDPAREPSLAIRAVYGQWFPWLVLLDPEWALTHAQAIFPQDHESEAFFEAAWKTYVVSSEPYDNVLGILRPQYEQAVERIGSRHDDTRWLADPDEKLAQHLMVFYWRGKLLPDDPLLASFWKNDPDGLRCHALEFVGRALMQTEGDIPTEILDRLKQLWGMRLATAKKAQEFSDFAKEMSAFGWWFVSGKFDVDWAIGQLSESLRLARKSAPDHMVLEHLATAAQTHPQESVECLRMVAEGDRDGWNLQVGRDHVRRILEVGLQHPGAADEAKRVIHYLGRRGFREFRDLLER
jgi:hypothetical protein